MDSTQDDGLLNANSDNSDQVVQPNSFDPKKFKEELLNTVKELISDPRTTQSIKDKTMAEIKKDKGFKDFLGEYKSMKEAGMTDKEIELEARLKEIEQTRTVQDNPGRVVENGQSESVKLFAKALELDLNDPEVFPVLSMSNMEEQLRTLKGLSDRRSKNISPAIAAQSAGGNPPSNLMEEYKARAAKTRGGALIDLKMEYRKKGLDIN